MRSGAAESDSNPGSKYCYLRRVRLPFHSHPQMLSHSSFPDHDCFHSGHAQAGLLRPAAEISRKRRIRIKPERLRAIKTNSFLRCSWSESILKMECSLERRHFECFWALFVIYVLEICNWCNTILCFRLMEVFFSLQAWKRASNIAKISRASATLRA